MTVSVMYQCPDCLAFTETVREPVDSQSECRAIMNAALHEPDCPRVAYDWFGERTKPPDVVAREKLEALGREYANRIEVLRQAAETDLMQRICAPYSNKVTEHWAHLMYSTLPFSRHLLIPRQGSDMWPSLRFAEWQWSLMHSERTRRDFSAHADGWYDNGRKKPYYETEWWNIVRSEQLRRKPFCILCFPAVVWAKEIAKCPGAKTLMYFYLEDMEEYGYQENLPLHVHHVGYYAGNTRIFGIEPLYMEFLETICSKHHGQLHGRIQ